MVTCDYAACPREAVARLDGYQFCPSHKFMHHLESADHVAPDGFPMRRFGSTSGRLMPCGSLGPLLEVLNRGPEQAAVA